MLEIERMAAYLKTLEMVVAQEDKRINEMYVRDIEGAQTEEERMMVEDHYGDLWWDSVAGFQQYWLASFIVSWYAFVEQRLIDVCAHLKLTIVLKPTDNPKLGTGIRLARQFLKNGAGYEIPGNYWNELVAIGRLRNIIVHRGLKIKGSYLPPEEDSPKGIQIQVQGNTFYYPIEENLHRYLVKHGLFQQVGVIAEIAPTFEYCEHLISFAKGMFSQIFTDLNIS